jgi:hypothetical protein
MAFFDFPPENRFRIFSGQELLSRSLCVFTMIIDFIFTVLVLVLKYLSIFLIISLWSMIIFAVFYNIFKVLFV